jgi:hypothetical protein
MKSVKDTPPDIKKSLRPQAPLSTASILDQAAEIRPPVTDRSDMSVLLYIALTVASFALLGWIQKLVEGL